MAECGVCKFDRGESGTCINCGSPVLSTEDAMALAGLGMQKDIEAAIRTAQKVAKSKPDFYLPKLRLAEAYQRKVRAGDRALGMLADRTFEEAVALLPAEREAHFCAIETASKLGKLPRLKEAYSTGSIDVPFAKDCLSAISSAGTAPESGPAGPTDRRRLVLMGAVLAVAAAGVLFLRSRGPGGGPSADYPNSDTYIPGTNLVQNGHAEEGWANWRIYGSCTFEMDGSYVFRLEGDDGSGAQASQDLVLPKNRPPVMLVLARTRCTVMPGDGMSGLPYLWGSIKSAGNQVQEWMQEYTMRHRADPGQWAVSWGTFALKPDAAYVELVLQQALRAGGTRKGNPAFFDDVGVYLFNSAINAREFAEKYDGGPPTDAMLSADAAVVPPPDGSKPAPAEIPTDKGDIMDQAKAMYDRLEVGMSIHEAGVIMGFDDRTGGWSKDFGYSMQPDCVTLNVMFKDEVVAWVALSKDYEPGNRMHPGRILEEKGQKPE